MKLLSIVTKNKCLHLSKENPAKHSLQWTPDINHVTCENVDSRARFSCQRIHQHVNLEIPLTVVIGLAFWLRELINFNHELVTTLNVD